MAPLILTTDGSYVIAAHVVSFFHCDEPDGTQSLYLLTTSGDDHCVIEKTSPKLEAALFKQIGLGIVSSGGGDTSE